MLAAPPEEQLVNITVLATPAIREAYAELVPVCEREIGHRVSITWVGTAVLPKRLSDGEVFDAIVCASNLLEELARSGSVVGGSRTDLARSLVGVAVKAGAAKPPFGSEAALRETLVRARTIGISTGPSGVYLDGLFRRMGVRQEIEAKLRVSPPGGMVAVLVASGEAEIGFQQVAELVNKPGIEYVGALPDSLQGVTVFSGGVHARASRPEAARELLRFLASPRHEAILRRHGLQLGSASPGRDVARQ